MSPVIDARLRAAMRILLVGGDFREGCQITGYVNAIREIAKGLAKKHEVHVVPFLPQRPQFSKDVNWNGARVISKRLTFRVFMNTLIGLPRSYRRVKPYLTMYDQHGSFVKLKATLKYVGLYAFNRAFFENELGKYEPEVVHVHGIVIQTLAYHDALLEGGHPYMTTVHGLYSHDENAYIDFDRRLEGDIIGELDHHGLKVTTVSNGLREEIIRLFSVAPVNLQVVQNGVDTSKFRAGDKIGLRKKFAFPADCKIVLSVGTVGKRKNQAAVLDALSVMTREGRAKLLYVSVGGGEVDDLRERVKSLGLTDAVILTGKVSDQELVELYSLADIFVLTSTSEGFGLVFLEAMAAGLPIVTYADLEAVGELYDSECMVLVHERTPDALASGIGNALTKDWNLERIRKKAEIWDWEKVVRGYEEVYGSLSEGCYHR